MLVFVMKETAIALAALYNVELSNSMPSSTIRNYPHSEKLDCYGQKIIGLLNLNWFGN